MYENCMECDDDFHEDLMECEPNTGLSSWKKHVSSLSRKVQRGSSKQVCHRNGRRHCRSCSKSKHVGRSLIYITRINPWVYGRI